LAAGNFAALEKLQRDLAAELAGARETFKAKALPAELRRIAGAYDEKLKRHQMPMRQIARRADELLANMAPKSKREGDGAERAIREGEIRRMLFENLPPEAGLTIEGADGETRWIVEQYERAVADGDSLLADAIENAPSVFPATMRLTKGELTELRTRRAEAEHPERAQTLGDYRAAIGDLEDASGEIAQNIEQVRKANPMPDDAPTDPIQQLASGGAA